MEASDSVGQLDAARSSGSSGCGCGTEGADSQFPFVYALGRIDWRFPNLGLEREFLQANRSVDTKGLSDPQARHAVLADRRNRYLARQLC